MHYRHGDLSFHPIESLPEGLFKVEHKGSYVLARGEHTGHKHVISAPDIEILKDKEGNYYIQVKTEASLVHEEHKKITFVPGIYRMKNEREMDYFLGEVTRVQD